MRLAAFEKNKKEKTEYCQICQNVIFTSYKKVVEKKFYAIVLSAATNAAGWSKSREMLGNQNLRICWTAKQLEDINDQMKRSDAEEDRQSKSTLLMKRKSFY